jgi:hypothetical protein
MNIGRKRRERSEEEKRSGWEEENGRGWKKRRV